MLQKPTTDSNSTSLGKSCVDIPLGSGKASRLRSNSSLIFLTSNKLIFAV